jgi:hypothetical protein
MPKTFTRILSFDVEGETYDEDTSPEDIIKCYSFHYKDYGDYRGVDQCFVMLDHKDHRGKITKISSRPRISKAKKPDTEYLII